VGGKEGRRNRMDFEGRPYKTTEGIGAQVLRDYGKRLFVLQTKDWKTLYMGGGGEKCYPYEGEKRGRGSLKTKPVPEPIDESPRTLLRRC